MRSRAHPWWGTYKYQKETAAVRGSNLYLFATPEKIDNLVRWWESKPDSIYGRLDRDFLDFCNVLLERRSPSVSMGASVAAPTCRLCTPEEAKRQEAMFFADLEGAFAPFAGAPRHFKKDK